MILIGTVGQVLSRKIEGKDALAMTLDVGTSIEIEKRIRWCGGLRLMGCIKVVLAKVAIHVKLQEEIVEGATIADELILDVRVPTWCRSERNILRVGWLMKLNRVDIRKTVPDVEMGQRMHIHRCLTTPDTSIR